MIERLQLGYSLEVILRLWLDHSFHKGLKHTLRVGPTDMYSIWYFGELTNLCAYVYVLNVFRYFQFQREGSGLTALHPLKDFSTLIITISL